MSVSSGDYWVVSDRVCFAEGPRPAAVLVQGSRIAGIQEAEEVRGLARQRPDMASHMFDVGADPLVPGWVNAHTHLAMAPLRGITSAAARAGNVVTDVFFKIESCMSAQDVLAFAKMGAYESALCGGLFVFDHYYFGEALALALSEVGICGVVGPTLADQGGPLPNQVEAQISATLQIAENSALEAKGITAALAPHAGDTVNQGLMNQVGDLARRYRLPVHLHLAQSLEEATSLAKGQPNIDSRVQLIAEQLDACSVLMAHGLYLSDNLVAELVLRNWILAYCPFSQMQFGFLGPLAAWLEHGGRVGVGTDCVASNDALDVQRELPLIAGDGSLRASYSPQRHALLTRGRYQDSVAVETLRKDELERPALIEPGQLLEAADGRAFAAWGNTNSKNPLHFSPLSVGALANFLILDATHPCLFGAGELGRTLAYGSTQNAIKQGVVAGRRIGWERGWREEWLDTSSYRDARVEAERRRAELFARAGII